jgi:hypothetical protein
MKSPPILLLIILLSLISAASARAEKRGIFLFQGLHQWVNFDYNYDGQSTSTRGSGSSSSQQHFEEKYHLGIDYSILNPNFFRGKLVGDFRLGQELSDNNGTSSSGDQRGIDYNISGEFFHRAPLTVNFFSLSQNNHIQSPFIPAYDLTTDSNFFQLTLKNRILPTVFSYNRTSNETSGLADDRKQLTQQFRIQNHYSYRGISVSDLTFTAFTDHSDSAGGTKVFDSRKYDIDFRNVLSAGTGPRTATLTSSLLVDQSSNIAIDKSLSLNESLTVHLGKGLMTGADYSLLTRETRFQSRAPTSQTSNMGRTYLQHSLFQSLTTRIDVNTRQDRLSSGSEDDYGGNFSVAYVKRLPKSGSLQLQFLQQYQVTDRSVFNANVFVFDERHTVVPSIGNSAIPDDVKLDNPNVDWSTLIVQNLDPLKNPLVRDIDYELVLLGSNTFIRPKSAKILIGDTLIVAYAYQTNPQIKYDTSSRNASATVVLNEGRYRFYANYSEIRQGLLAGRADTVRLLSGTTYRFGFETNLEYLKYGSDVEIASSVDEKHKSAQGFVNYQLEFAKGLLSLTLADRYLVTELTQTGSSSTAINSVNAGLTYSRNIFSSAQMSFYGLVSDSRGDDVSRNDISARFTLRWVLGKFTMSLLAQEDWRFVKDLTTRNDQLQVRLQRFF